MARRGRQGKELFCTRGRGSPKPATHPYDPAWDPGGPGALKPRTHPLDQGLQLSQTSLTPTWAFPTWGSWSSLRGQAQWASGARHRGQRRQQGQEQRGGSACKRACQRFPVVLAPPRFRLGRDSHDRRELAPSHRDMVGLGQGPAGGGSRQKGGAWKE